MKVFIQRQIVQLRIGGVNLFFTRKLSILIRYILRYIQYIPFLPIAFPIVLVIRLIRPWCLIRFGYLLTRQIGDFAANTELYLCEKDAGINVPKDRYYIDFFTVSSMYPVSNRYFLSMWKRSLFILPEVILGSIIFISRLLSGWKIHEIGQNTQNDRDVHNLFMRYPVHLKFTKEEEEKGARNLEDMGVPQGKPFVCLYVRDGLYHEKRDKFLAYTNSLRNADIDNYILATEELVKRGYYVIRMGAIVRKPLKVDHPNVIDYAWTGIRSEFMDIYLGATCDFCVSTLSGWDTIPYIFRKPIVYTNLGESFLAMYTFQKTYLAISKKFWDMATGKYLSLKEIYNRELYLDGSLIDPTKITPIENTPEEIRDVVIEMVERLNNTWQTTEEDEELQARFWKLFPTHIRDSHGEIRPFHGKIYSRVGTKFLRGNKELYI